MMMGDLRISEMEDLNGLSYCEEHGREVCHDCKSDYAYLNENHSRFELPETGVPQYPRVLKSIRDKQLRKHLGKRWLEMQKELCESQPAALTSKLINLPHVEVPDEVKTSPVALQGTLLRLFRQLQGMASTQRYYFANQSKIMLQDYEIFSKGAVLYQEELSDQFSRGEDLYAMRCGQHLSQGERKRFTILKAKASILSTFGFFLELNTQRTFWRAMELTVEAFVVHIESFNEEADGQAVMTDKAKGFFLQWLAHFFWSLQHAQCRLNGLRAIQLEVYQRGVFPFFPYTMKALEDDADIHLVIARLSKARIYDLPLFSALLSKLGQASAIPEQMQCINADIMAAIDELSTRFRVLETLILAAHLVATEKEIKLALTTFKFNPNGKEVNSRTDDVMLMVTSVEQTDREEVSRNQSFLQKLIVKENLFRKNNVDRVMKPPFAIDSSDRIPKEVFDVFKSNFRELYRESIRRQWREDEHSLLGLDIARRFQHRLEIAKKKQKKKRPLSSEGFEKADMGEVRSVPEKVYVDPSLFWEVGDGTLEKYVPPVVRTKIKTRKEGMDTEQEDQIVMAGSEGASSPVSTARSSDAAEDTPQFVQRPLDQLKHSDLRTRDILWRKVKGSLKWSQLVQFLSRLGCKILNLDGSKRKIVDPLSGRCTVLHRPHPGDECRPDQRESYRVHIEDWLKIEYTHLARPDEEEGETEMLDSGSTTGSTSGA